MRFVTLSVLFLLSTDCFADLKIEIDAKSTNTIVVSGLVNPVVSPDGTVTADEGSEPIVEPKSQKTLRVVTDAKFVDLTIERLVVVDGRVERQRPNVFPSSVAVPNTFEYVVQGDGEYEVFVSAFGPGIQKAQSTIQLSKPKPKPPKPDDPPKPEPVKSFRVIFVKESGSLMPKDQMAISGAKTVRDYLTQRTTPEGGLAGWREYDPQQNVANEQATMKELWTAAKSSITKVPSLVVEKNGKVEILEYPKNVADALKLLKEYGGQ
jgi:hypothetical protein